MYNANFGFRFLENFSFKIVFDRLMLPEFIKFVLKVLTVSDKIFKTSLR